MDRTEHMKQRADAARAKAEAARERRASDLAEAISGSAVSAPVDPAAAAKDFREDE